MSPSSSVPLRAAKALLWRGDERVELAVVEGHSGWTLPGTALTDGETELEAAVRAVTPLAAAAAPGRFLGVSRAPSADGDGGRPVLTAGWVLESLVDGESAGRWAEPDEAERLLAAQAERDALRAFLSGPRRVGRVVLLRHCEAEQWREGDDLLRPLTDVGSARAGRLVAVAAALRPDALMSSPALRCRDTLGPASVLLRRELVEEPLLGEAGRDRDKVGAMLEERARAGESVLVCTHAPVVMALLERFATHRPQLLPRPARLDAGGAWNVEFTPTGVIGMSYLPPPAPAEAE